MSKTLRLSLALVVAAFVSWSVFADTQPAAQTLKGSYIWEQAQETGALEAIFTPDGAGHWKVAFHFTFQGEAHVYSGTADGSLTNGSLAGRVQTDSGKGVFTFSGEFKDGKFQGSHARLTAGNEERTGTLSLGA
ncbi:MAG: hypothetical protein SF066_10785 [Thermoanaerobaculia bacterium]|nr:hypothetical protein [Thermoanaerobaculia bacterium]